MSRRVIITAPPPTPNGDLHVGHLSGPFLAADVFCRFVRAKGGQTAFASYSDDNQSYVETTAARLGEAPEALCKRCTEEIQNTLAAARIEMDGYFRTDADHSAYTCRFLKELFARGVLKLKEKEFYFSPETQSYLFEAFLTGYCPECLAETKGGICETCGHPNNFTEILQPRATLKPDARLVKKMVPVVVLELEQFRERLKAFYRDKQGHWRPHILRLVQECLEKPLPDFPITYPHSWGIPAPFPGTENQVINAWPELLTGLIKSTTAVARQKGQAAGADDIWQHEHGWQLVQFFGYDNSFFYTFVHLSLLMAYEGWYVLPSTMLINEFYEFDNYKFSTSKNHVIWARDLLEKHGIYYARFYLALTNPSFQKANFTTEEMSKLVPDKLIEPWARMSGNMNRLLTAVRFVHGASYRPTAEGARQIQTVIRRYERFYEIDTMNLREAAETLTHVLEWVSRRSEFLANEFSRGSEAINPRLAADLWALVAALSSILWPLMPEFAARLRIALGLPTEVRWPDDPPSLWKITPAKIPVTILPPLDSSHIDRLGENTMRAA
jgi:methionyl-tRNA synthetase